MKLRYYYVFLISGLILFSGCSNTRFLSEDQMLYTGRRDIEIRNQKNISDAGEAKSYVRSITANKANNSVLGLRILPPFSLWIHNYCKPEKEKGLGKWFYEAFSKPPILVTDVNPELRAEKIQNELNNRGFFHTTASAEIHARKHNPKKAKVSYIVDLQPPWHINRIVMDSGSHRTDSIINATELKGVIEPGDRFSLSAIKTVKTIMAGNLHENGYFFFTPDHISIKADSGIGGRKIDLFPGRKENLDEDILSRYRINNIILRMTKTARSYDSLMVDTIHYKDITVVSPELIIKPEILYEAFVIRNGDIYSLSAYRKTLSNLNNLGIFRLVNLNFRISDQDTSRHQLDVLAEMLVPMKLDLSLESNLVTKSTGFTGPAIIAAIQHKNAFKGAEKLELKLTGSMEWQWYRNYTSELGSYSYELGANSALTVPRILLPNVVNTGRMVTRKTSISGGFSLLNRTSFYRLNAIRAGFSYQWGWSEKVQHTFYPFYLNSVKLLKTTQAFDSIINSNIYIRRSFEEQFILGFRYEFIYDNKTAEKPGTFLFMGGAYTSGNLISILSKRSDDVSREPRTFLNSVYSQFLKFTSDARYYLTGGNQTLVFRFFAGIGMPYGNSSVLPYVEQFFSGGAYSIRGFPARGLGPGGYYEGSRGFIDQSGDIRFEMNLEYRIMFTKLLNGALFLETGNVWLWNDDPVRPGAQFRGDMFLNQLAVGTGLGLRFDLGFFVLRTDLGLPVRTPYTANGSHHVGDLGEMLKKSVFHLAIGYPF